MNKLGIGLLPKDVLLIIYSYLPTMKILDIRSLSKHSKEILIDASVISDKRVFNIVFTNDSPCLLHESFLEEKIEKKEVILELVSEIKLDLSACNYNCRPPCGHRLDERLSELISILPSKFDRKRISLEIPSAIYKFTWDKFLLFSLSTKPDLVFKSIKLRDLQS